MPELNLPPLPPFGGGTTGRNVVDVLAEQHRELLRLADRLAAGGPDTRRVAQVLIAEVSRHLSAEEQYLYPAIRQVVPDGDRLADRELSEDRDLLVALQAFDRLRYGDAGWSEAAARVRTALARHVEADATELLPRLVREVPVDDLVRIGNRVEIAEESAPTRPHPGGPLRPPWNKLVDPLVAVADKVRDVVGRRTTYERDL